MSWIKAHLFQKYGTSFVSGRNRTDYSKFPPAGQPCDFVIVVRKESYLSGWYFWLAESEFSRFSVNFQTFFFMLYMKRRNVRAWALEHSPSWEAHYFSAIVKKFPTFYGHQGSLLHYKCPPPVPILSQINPVHVSHPTSWRSILILSSHLSLGLPSGLFPQVSPPPVHNFPLPHVCYLPSLSYSSRFDHTTPLGEEYSLLSYSLCSFLHSLVTSSHLDPNIFLSASFSKALAYIPSSLCASKFHTLDKWVTVTMAWSVPELWMEERPPIWRVAVNILNNQSQTADKGLSSSLGVGQGTDNSSP